MATAYLTALARAEATADPRTEFEDRFASRFADLCPDQIMRVTRATAGRPVVAVRTSIIDRMVAESVGGGDIDLCINLGAGFDSRPFRLDWNAGCPVIEVDAPAIFDVKDRLLPAADGLVPVERIGCDVRDVDGLTSILAPRAAQQRLLIVSEGLLAYFPELYVASLAAALVRLGSSATWICDVMSRQSARTLTATAEAAGVALNFFGLTDTKAFEENGWVCTRLNLLPSSRLPSGAGDAADGGGATSRIPDAVLELAKPAR